jgi:acetylornithine deacetylase/succinyl-diaminopimelate desuccinylase-like protein
LPPPPSRLHPALSQKTTTPISKAEIAKRHDEAVQRLHDWIAQVSIAAENRGYPEGAEYPGYVFTGERLKLAAGHFGLGHGSGAHAPDEYYVIESANPKIQSFDGAVMSFVEYLYELAK